MKKYIEIDVGLLVPSLTNPRKSFGDLNDLAASIKAQGVLEPLIVRAVGEKFEIIAGERRFKAAKQNGLDKVPCVVHDLKDEDVLEVQIIENMQRTDLSPMEEAEGYKILHDDKGISFDDLALRIGKSKNYIYTRLRLLSLIPEARKMLIEGKMPLSYADQLTRVCDAKMQKEIIEELKNDYISDLPTLKRTIDEQYVLVLKNAPFKTGVVTPGCNLGPCTSCEKRTGADKDLFGEAGKTDSCQDPICWNKRKEAYKKAITEQYALKGIKVLTPKESERFQYNKTLANSTDERLKAGVTWKEALKGGEGEILVIEDRDGKFIEIVDPSKAIKKVPKELIKKVAAAKEDDTAKKAEEEKEARAEAIKERSIILLADAISKKMNKSGVTAKIFRMALNMIIEKMAFNFSEILTAVYESAVLDDSGSICLDNIKDNELPGVFAFMLVGKIKQDLKWDDQELKKGLSEIAKLYSIDMAEVKNKAVASLKVEKKEVA